MVTVENTTNPRVLIVEDEPLLRETLEQILGLSGFDVVSAENGKVALDVLSQGRVNLVLSDVQMPVMGGLELLRNIKEVEPTLKVVFFSAFTDLTHEQAISLGAVGLLSKPIRIEVLVEKLQEYLGL